MSASDTILQVGTSDRAGGAERVMMDLHAEYQRRGLDAWVAVGFKRTDAPNVLEMPNDAGRSAWARALGGASARMGAARGGVRRGAARALLYLSDPARYSAVLAGREDMDYPATRRLLDLPPRTPGTLHLHNLHGGYFDVRALPALTSQVPTVITLHDAWLLTGHCAHPFACAGWRTGCVECPYLDIPIAISRDAAAANLRLKRTALSSSRFALVAPSAWLMKMAEETGVAEMAITSRVIPNGVDTRLFTPGDKSAARSRLGLPAEAEIVLVSGQSLVDNPYKDFPTLAKALPILRASRGEKLLLVALGSDAAAAPSLPGTVHVPFTEDAEAVTAYLQAADVYAHPARAENLPLSVIEAMACGTPVVATRVGGIPELIEDGVTGLLAEPGDASGLARAIATLLGDPALRARLSEAALATVPVRYTLPRMAEAYLGLYREAASL